MKRILLAVALFLSAVPAFGSSCVSLESMRSQVADVPGAVLTKVDAPAVQTAVDLYNTFAPEHAQATDTAALIDLPNGGGFLVAGKDGQICGMVRFAPREWLLIRSAVLGQDA